MSTHTIFPTFIYNNKLQTQKNLEIKLNKSLINEIHELAKSDKAGLDWSKKNYKNGYTSYASANQMHIYSPTFADLENLIRPHVGKLVKTIGLDINLKKLKMSTCWVNIMPPNTLHSMHIHPLSVVSGTYYVETPKGSSSIRFEDPRYLQFMSRPPLKEVIKNQNKIHFSVNPNAGEIVLFESWLKHEVPANNSAKPRISISFNYDWV